MYDPETNSDDVQEIQTKHEDQYLVGWTAVTRFMKRNHLIPLDGVNYAYKNFGYSVGTGWEDACNHYLMAVELDEPDNLPWDIQS